MSYSQDQLRTIFSAKFDATKWQEMLINIFHAQALRATPERIDSDNAADHGYFLGQLTTTDNYTIGLFRYHLQSDVSRRRVALRQLVKQYIHKDYGQFDAALVVFASATGPWRISLFCDIATEAMEPKRFTFLVGDDNSRHNTVITRLLPLQTHKLAWQEIKDAFSVEVLSREFFDKYKAYYERFVTALSDSDDKLAAFGNKAHTIGDDTHKAIRDFVKKQLGRIVFLHFLQRKGWLGVPADKSWGDGDRQFLRKLYDRATPGQKDNFLDQVLIPLFANALNKSHPSDLYDTKVKGYNNIKIPYLNGGLFECDDIDRHPWNIPSTLFDELLTMLAEYNFTIDENDPNDAEVGIDPEMLGRIFENLLEDNNDKGAFYTPKEIVQYMCRESLIAYLSTDMPETQSDNIRYFVTTHDTQCIADIAGTIAEKLVAVKICDPAIGSGAFPMGLLRELFYCRTALTTDANHSPADIKRDIIQNNIYGVDIELGAVEIARLRFWLALVVDETTPTTLPNLDFKIMQGNSLIEQYQGVDLTDISIAGSHTGELIFDSATCNRALIQENIHHYYRTDDHHARQELRGRINTAVKGLIIANDYRLEDKVRDLDIQNNSHFFLWHTWFADVFQRHGFDIVIGNPPYIQLQNNNGALAQQYRPIGYDTFASTGDIYCLFYEQGLRLLRPKGHLCLITSNKWMRAGYGSALRQHLATKSNPQLLIDCAGVRVFTSATVDTNILLASRETNHHATRCVALANATKDTLRDIHSYVSANSTIHAFTTDDTWVILSPIEQAIKDKIEAIGTPLKDWNIDINYGIKTGFNKAFIITTDQRQQLLDHCRTADERQRTEALLRPILRGRDIKRYGYTWAGLWLIYIPWHFPCQFDKSIMGASLKAEQAFKEQYPAVYAHLAQYKDKLSKRNQAETGIRYEWYALQRWGANYWQDFDKPKIVYPETTQGAYFAYDDQGLMIEKTCFMMITPHARYLQATLSSKLFEFAYKKLYSSVELGKHGYQYNKHALIKLPVYKEYTEQETYDDEYFYRLYHLTPAEVDAIQHNP